MKRVFGLAIVALVMFSAARAAQKPSLSRSAYSDASYGFTLNAPAFSSGANQQVTPVVFKGPEEAGFTNNVNVTIQPVKTTRKDYKELSLGQFAKIGLTLNSCRDVKVSGREALRIDYQGKIGNNNLRFLCVAVIEKDRVILATCAARVETFEAIEPEFKACLDSFELR